MKREGKAYIGLTHISILIKKRPGLLWEVEAEYSTGSTVRLRGKGAKKVALLFACNSRVRNKINMEECI